jgi:hypothetical protein
MKTQASSNRTSGPTGQGCSGTSETSAGRESPRPAQATGNARVREQRYPGTQVLGKNAVLARLCGQLSARSWMPLLVPALASFAVLWLLKAFWPRARTWQSFSDRVTCGLLVLGVLTWLCMVWYTCRFEKKYCNGRHRDGLRPFAGTRTKTYVLLVIFPFVAAAILLFLEEVIPIPRQLQGSGLSLLVSAVFSWTAGTYMHAVMSVTPLLKSRHLLSAAEHWAGVRTRLLFHLQLILVAWLVANLLSKQDPSGSTALEALPDIHRYLIPDDSPLKDVLSRLVRDSSPLERVRDVVSGLLLSASQAPSNQIGFLGPFVLALSLVLAVNAMTRRVWSMLLRLGRALKLPASPGVFLFAASCAILVAVALYLVAAHPFYTIRAQGAAVLHSGRIGSAPWNHVPLVALSALLFVLLAKAGKTIGQFWRSSMFILRGPAANKTAGEQTPRLRLLLVLSIPMILVCGFGIASVGVTWLEETAPPDHSSVSVVLANEPEWHGEQNPTISDREAWRLVAAEQRWSANVATNSGDTDRFRAVRCILAFLGIAWLLALFTLGNGVLPQPGSIADDTQVANRALRDPVARGYLRALTFLSQCFSDDPVALLAGIVHVAATVVLFFDALGAPEPSTLSLALVAASTLPLLLKAIIVGALNREALFARATARIVGGSALTQLERHLLVIGAGNLGRSALAKYWRYHASSLDFSLSHSFLTFVDSNGSIQTLTLQAVVTERNASVLSATYPWTGQLSVGYVKLSKDESRDLTGPLRIPQAKGEPVDPEDELRDICYPALCADGATGDTYDLLSWRDAFWIFVATGDPECGRRAMELVDSQKRTMESMGRAHCSPEESAVPGCIIRVENGNTYRDIMRSNLNRDGVMPLFLVYPAPDEAENLVRQMIVERGYLKTGDPKARRVLVVGGRRRFPYTCRAILGELERVMAPKDAITWVQEHVHLLTSEPGAENRVLFEETEWHEFLFRVLETKGEAIIETLRVAHVDYTALRHQIEKLANNETGLDVIVFGDEDAEVVGAVSNVAHDVRRWSNPGSVSFCTTVNAGKWVPGSCSERAGASRPRLGTVIHDEVIAAEVFSSLDIFPGRAAAGRVQSSGDRLSLFICKKDVPGILFWLALVLGGVERSCAEKIVEGLCRPDTPSWHYYFIESGVWLLQEDDTPPRMGFRFRAGFSLETASQGMEKPGEAVKAVGVLNWSTGKWSPKGGDWADLLGAHRPHGNGDSPPNEEHCVTEGCWTLCPHVLRGEDVEHSCNKASGTTGQLQEPTSRSTEPTVALDTAGGCRGRSQPPFCSTVGSVDVICIGRDDPGHFAALLANLMGLNWENIAVGNEPNKRAMNISFIKSNEFCGPGHTFCTIHGEVVDYAPSHEKQAEEREKPLLFSEPKKSLSHIVRVEVEGGQRVDKYWEELTKRIDSDKRNGKELRSGGKRVWLRNGYRDNLIPESRTRDGRARSVDSVRILEESCPKRGTEAGGDGVESAARPGEDDLGGDRIGSVVQPGARDLGPQMRPPVASVPPRSGAAP